MIHVSYIHVPYFLFFLRGSLELRAEFSNFRCFTSRSTAAFFLSFLPASQSSDKCGAIASGSVRLLAIQLSLQLVNLVVELLDDVVILCNMVIYVGGILTSLQVSERVHNKFISSIIPRNGNL